VVLIGHLFDVLVGSEEVEDVGKASKKSKKSKKKSDLVDWRFGFFGFLLHNLSVAGRGGISLEWKFCSIIYLIGA